MTKWFAVLLITLVFWATAQTKCLVSDFYGLSFLHNPSERHQRLSEWLTTNGDSCSSEQLVGIWNNLALWAGVADSGEIRQKILFYYARAIEREKK
jgi:hypothetical protein